MYKYLLVVLSILAGVNVSFDQQTQRARLSDVIGDGIPKHGTSDDRAGSCADPDGSMSSTASAPSGYAWLSANGYCNPGSYGNTVTVCWTFTPSSTSVEINSGWSGSGCINYSFAGFTVYECDPSCAVVGTGLTYTGLTVGDCYTFCMDADSWGGGPSCTGYDDFCPYFINNSTLPVEVYSFIGFKDGKRNVFKWMTLFEEENDRFIIEHSTDGDYWTEKGSVSGSINSSDQLEYEWIDESPARSINYYRLKQVDVNGKESYHGIISMDNQPDQAPKVIRTLNIFGQEVAEDYDGVIIEVYDDGSFKRLMKLK